MDGKTVHPKRNTAPSPSPFRNLRICLLQSYVATSRVIASTPPGHASKD